MHISCVCELLYGFFQRYLIYSYIGGDTKVSDTLSSSAHTHILRMQFKALYYNP